MVSTSWSLVAIVAVALVSTAALAQQEDTIEISMVAIQASFEDREEKLYDRTLDSVRQALEDLDEYDTFRLVREQKRPAQYREKTRIQVNDRYTLIITPMGRDSRGRIRIQASIEEEIRRNDEIITRTALEFTSNVAPGRPLKLCGLRLDEGELVLVVTMTVRRSDRERSSDQPSGRILPRMSFR